MDKFLTLRDYGLKANIIDEFMGCSDKYSLGRVIIEHKGIYRIITESGEVNGRVSGKMQYNASKPSDFPSVGDWVALDSSDSESDVVIHKIMKRLSVFSRQVAGTKSDEQIIATNIDKVFICMDAYKDFNINRIERYMSLAWSSGAMPIIILTKIDLCDDIDNKILEIQNNIFGVDVIAVSSYTKAGFNEINQFINSNDTIAFIGSSGIGKSSIINILFGEERLSTGSVRHDGKGKHTTTHRELIKLPFGGLVIDTPGMREIQLFDADVSTTFLDIETLAQSCYFSDCLHENEPRCAVREAIVLGELSKERFGNYLKIKKETEFNISKLNMNTRQIEKKKAISMMGSLNGRKQLYENRPKK